jgi:nicotinate-nucleotide adenylyltransferase
MDINCQIFYGKEANNRDKNNNRFKIFIFKNIEGELNIIISYGKYLLVLLILLIDIPYLPDFILYYFFLFSNCYCYCIRTGIYGGSFNPIHNGHIALARQMIESGLMDEVWFMVSPLNPFKKEKSDLLSDELRLEMTRLALEGETKMIAQDFEFHLPKPSYTWQTLQALSEVYPNRQFILIIGGDNWQLFDRWFHYQDILNNYSLVVYPREGINIDADSLPNNVKLLKAQLYPISSTQVRQNIKEGKPIDDLIPRTIIQKALKYYKGN